MPRSRKKNRSRSRSLSVEAVLDIKPNWFGPGETGYLVKWKGYGHLDNTWEPSENMSHAQESIGDYLSEYSIPSPMPPAPEHIPLRGRPQHVPIESSTPDSSHSQQPEPEPQLDSDLFLENDAASSSAQLLSRSRLAQEIVPTTVRDHRLGRNSLLVGHIPFDSCIDPFVDQPESWSSVQDILGLRQEAGHIVVYMRTFNGKLFKCAHTRCHEMIPRQIADFYVRNLAWRTEQRA